MNRISRWLLFCFISVGILSCEEDGAFVFLQGEYNVESIELTNTIVEINGGNELIKTQVISLNGGSVVAEFNDEGSYTMNGNTTIVFTETINNQNPVTTVDDNSPVNILGSYEINEIENTVLLNNFFDPSIFNNHALTVTSFSDNQLTIELNVDTASNGGGQRNFRSIMIFSRR